MYHTYVFIEHDIITSISRVSFVRAIIMITKLKAIIHRSSQSMINVLTEYDEYFIDNRYLQLYRDNL